MRHDMEYGGRPGTPVARRPAPRWSVIAVCAPFVGAAAVLTFLALVGTQGHWYWTWRGPYFSGFSLMARKQ